MKKVLVWITCLLLCSCSRPPPATATPPPATATPPPAAAIFASPEVPSLSPLGEQLIISFEVGGREAYSVHPEAPDARYSGITFAIGFDAHQNSPEFIQSSFSSLSAPAPARLAATHPFYGKTAQEHLHEVRDIIVPWQVAIGIFDKIDVARTWAQCERAFLGFDNLRPNAQAALVSLVFNRGASMTGDSRREMRGVRDAVPKADYATMATQIRQMERVFRGTSIYRGMVRRRNAEAALILTP